ncbi:DUF2560 family protein [Serratia marcescens]|uniref:DUF2560 family protein n=1 Tax=Serratia marcescens TaxID=615 RepID=UPI00202A9BC4
MMAITEMTEEQKLKLEIYSLVQFSNAAAEEAFAFIGTDRMKLELFKIRYNANTANGDSVTRAVTSVREAKEALDLFTPGA